MVREDWQNLNGLWDYSIQSKEGAEAVRAESDGKILVPFAVESALSGVGKTVGKDSALCDDKEAAQLCQSCDDVVRQAVSEPASHVALHR